MPTHALKRALAMTLATLLAGFGALLLAVSGLPERQEFTGFIDSLGVFVAPEIGAQAPAIDIPTLSGQSFESGNTQAQLVVLNFWATWCGPCRAEMADLQAFHADYGNRVQIVGINAGEPPGQVTAWVSELGLTFDITIDYDGQINEQFRVRGLPTTYVIDSKGFIVNIFYGPITYQTLEQILIQQTAE